MNSGEIDLKYLKNAEHPAVLISADGNTKTGTCHLARIRPRRPHLMSHGMSWLKKIGWDQNGRQNGTFCGNFNITTKTTDLPLTMIK